jgi:UDP-glucose 4-epimerase
MRSNEHYSGRAALITGGAGFIGSNLAHALLARGARVTVVDNFHPDYGGNEFNFEGIRDKITLVRGDITDQPLMKRLAGEADVIFHVAAQCSHVDSMTNPWLDLEYNCKGTLSVLEGVRQSPRKPAFVYAGTRAMIGRESRRSIMPARAL